MIKFEIGEAYRKTPHLLADLTELLLLAGYLGKEELHQSDIDYVVRNGVPSAEEMSELLRDEDDDIATAEKNELRDAQLEDLFSHLEYREGAFGEYYPFKIHGEKISLLRELTPKQRVYSLLLACSRLRSFPEANGLRQSWANFFTRLSRVALAGLLPTYANVRIFDMHSEDRATYYGNQLREALKILGSVNTNYPNLVKWVNGNHRDPIPANREQPSPPEG